MMIDWKRRAMLMDKQAKRWRGRYEVLLIKYATVKVYSRWDSEEKDNLREMNSMMRAALEQYPEWDKQGICKICKNSHWMGHNSKCIWHKDNQDKFI